jgi:hypothetical protein
VKTVITDLTLNKVIAAAFLVAGIFVQTLGMAAQAGTVATVTEDPEAAAKRNWREKITEQSASGQGNGCFHATYPNFIWEAVACSTKGKASSHPTPNRAPDGGPGPQEGGAMGDYVALIQNGIITHVAGTFYQVSGVTSETNVDSNGNNMGSNDYGLQINTNWSLTSAPPNSALLPTYAPAACQGHTGCQIWQQFIYTTDQDGDPGPAPSHSELFMQYWLFNWISATEFQSNGGNCPHGWNPHNSSNGGLDCWRNGHVQSVPVIVPVTGLGDVKLSCSVQINGNDELYFSYGADAYAVIESDNFDNDHPNEDGIDIASIWQSVEFNVVGNTNASQATFNPGSVLGVTVNVLNDSNLPLLCLNDNDPRVNGVGTTSETNNLSLGRCSSTVVNGYSAIQFTESAPVPCPACGPVVPGPPPPIEL